MDKSAALTTLELEIQAIRQRSRLQTKELVERFVGEARKVGCEIQKAKDMAEAGHCVVDIARRQNASLVQISTEALLNELHLRNDGAGKRIEFKGPIAETMLSADLGVSDAVFAVAETGSAMIHLDNVDSRLTTMLPPAHTVVLRRKSIVESLEAGLTITRHRILAANIAGKPSYMTWVTGPSRTADIERVLTIGVHGPKELYIILVES
jgi:L-lactate dehydrogenase complex protein LldG